MTSHDHPPEGDCQPSCPAWAEGVLELCALRRRHDAMLAACRAADHVEFLIVAPATPGLVLPEFLHREELVRLNLVVGRDCPELMLDEQGIQATLTFRGRRHECVLPWGAVRGGLLAPPKKKARRFGVVEGGADATPTPTPTSSGSVSSVAARPEPLDSAAQERDSARDKLRAPREVEGPESRGTSTPTQTPPATPRPRIPFGVIPGGKSRRED